MVVSSPARSMARFYLSPYLVESGENRERETDMQTTRWISAWILFIFLATSPLVQAAETADWVVRNARIYTVNALSPWANAMAIKDKRLILIGSEQEVDKLIGPDTRVEDAGGRLILPGFHDTHVHMALNASKRHWCDVGYPQTLEATRSAILSCITASKGKEWVLISNANTAAFPKDGLPAGFLDDIISDRPLVIDAVHSSFVNSKAMRIAGINKTTLDPVNGMIVRDSSGTPTGTFRESAKLMMEDRIPRQTPEEFNRNLREVVAEMSRFGVVSVQELTSMLPVQFYDDALKKGWLTTRVRYGQIVGSGDRTPSDKDVANFILAGKHHQSRWLNANTIKLYIDGDLGDQTAAMMEPYENSSERGEPIWTQEQLNIQVAKFDAAGMQLHLHAVGDRAISMALDAIENSQLINGRRDARHQITHLHAISDQDLPRFKQLGVIANVQPYFATNIDYNTTRALELLGAERHRRMFRFKDLLEHGARVVVSTDSPVSPINPMVSIQAAMTRMEKGVDAPPFLPGQSLSLKEVIEAYTLGGAFANFLDRDSGSLEVGKYADFVMLDQNLFDIDADRFDETQVIWTVVEGEEVHRVK